MLIVKNRNFSNILEFFFFFPIAKCLAGLLSVTEQGTQFSPLMYVSIMMMYFAQYKTI